MKPFDIRNHLDNLEPNPKEKGKYICPVCGGNDLAISAQTGAYNCFSNGCKPADIRNIIAPLAKGQRPPKTEQRRNADAARDAAAIENKATNLLMLITLEEITLAQAQVELSAWCKQHGHDRFAAGQLLREKAKSTSQVSELSAQVNASQRGTDKLKARQGKDFDAQVSKSVDSKEDIELVEDIVTPQEWERFAQTMKTPGSFDPFLWLPEELARVARSDAARNSVDPMAIWGYLFPATLSMMGAGTKTNVWNIPNIGWSLVVADSGMGKSRAKELVMDPLDELNAQEFEDWQARMDDWMRQERAKAKDKSDDSDPTPKPVCRRYVISHSTPEGMVRRLKDQDGHGVVACRDEFAGWIKGLTQYNPNGNGMELLLETWGGGSILVDRVREEDSFLVKSSRLSLVGGIQPQIFSKIFELSDPQGILGRFMCLLPTEFPYKRYKGANLLPGLLKKIYRFIDQTEWGTITLTDDADDLFTVISEDFLNQPWPSLSVKPWLKKLPGNTLRLAMAIHALECYYDRSKDPKTLTADTLARAYHMAQHYQRHFYHLMGLVSADGLEGILAKIQSLACCSGDGLTARDIARGAAGSRIKALAQSEGMRPPAFCLKLFQELAANGWGELKETLAANGRKRISYHAFPDHCSNFTDSLTGIDTTLEHQGLRTVNEPLTSVDQNADLGHDYTLRDTRNQGVQPSGHENEFTDLDSSKEESNQYIPISRHSSPPHNTNGNGSTNGHHQNGSTPPDYSGLTPENLEDYGFEDF